MYAIRSYYDLYKLVFSVTNPAGEVVEARTHRITSYNVCYTKLLRPKAKADLGDIRLDELRTVVVEICEHGLDLSPTSEVLLEESVITSYSIHYTKLYDILCKLRLRFARLSGGLLGS